MSVTGTTLTVTPNAGFTGVFYVNVSVSDGKGGTANEEFKVTVNPGTIQPPVLTPIADQTTTAGTAFNVTLSATNPNNGTLTFSARADTQAYVLEQQYGFHFTGNYYLNWGGKQEKWFESAANQWYFILPTVSCTCGITPATANGTLIATLATTYYTDPTSLFNATPGRRPGNSERHGHDLDRHAQRRLHRRLLCQCLSQRRQGRDRQRGVHGHRQPGDHPTTGSHGDSRSDHDRGHGLQRHPLGHQSQQRHPDLLRPRRHTGLRAGAAVRLPLHRQLPTQLGWQAGEMVRERG